MIQRTKEANPVAARSSTVLHLLCSLPIIHLPPPPNLAHQPRSFFNKKLPRCRVSLPPSFVLLLIANSWLCSCLLWFIPPA
ncbi:hypothetical protein BDV09DRAFT_57925 [Aspergillus tetrazonus]